MWGLMVLLMVFDPILGSCISSNTASRKSHTPISGQVVKDRQRRSLTEAMKQEALEEHNKLRKGEGAASMKRMVSLVTFKKIFAIFVSVECVAFDDKR